MKSEMNSENAPFKIRGLSERGLRVSLFYYVQCLCQVRVRRERWIDRLSRSGVNTFAVLKVSFYLFSRILFYFLFYFILFYFIIFYFPILAEAR